MGGGETKHIWLSDSGWCMTAVVVLSGLSISHWRNPRNKTTLSEVK